MIGFLPLADTKMIYRSRQDSNLRGETPLDFKSNALTTRPRLLMRHSLKIIHLLKVEDTI